MYQAVEMPGGLLDLFSHVIVAVEVEDVCDQVQRILIVLDLRVESGEVETICEIFFVYFAEILISPRRDEPIPPITRIITIRFARKVLHHRLHRRRCNLDRQPAVDVVERVVGEETQARPTLLVTGQHGRSCFVREKGRL